VRSEFISVIRCLLHRTHNGKSLDGSLLRIQDGKANFIDI
jgi:hypothetical protein